LVAIGCPRQLTARCLFFGLFRVLFGLFRATSWPRHPVTDSRYEKAALRR